MTIINLTPHAITLRSSAGDTVIPSSGVARCTPGASALDEAASAAAGVPVYRSGPMGPVTGVPDPVDGVFLVVSALVAGHPGMSGRADILAPGTGPQDGAIRNAAGQIEAVTRLIGR